MPRSYWLSVIALGLIALCGGVDGKPVDQHANKRASTEERHNQPASDTKPSELVSIQHQIERIARALEAANAKKTPRDDSGQRGANAEEWGSKWALGMLIVAGLETAITFLGVFLVWQTLKAARADSAENKRAADAAEQSVVASREVGQAQIRAYLACEGGEFSLAQQQINGTIFFKNFGQSPARGVKISARVISICVGTAGHPIVGNNNISAGTVSQAHEVGCTIVASGASPKIGVHWIPTTITQAEMNLFHGGTPIVLIGRLQWTDVFNISNHIDFSLSENQQAYQGNVPATRHGPLELSPNPFVLA